MDTPVRSSIADLFRADGIDVTEDPAECAFWSADIAGGADEPARAILHPANTDEVQRIVRKARAEGVILFPRGGGWSYTGGFRPHGERGAIVETGHLQDITIDREGGTVEAGAGVTWEALGTALGAAGLRVCSFGPLSGIGATVGGGAAQNGGFFGNAGHGALGDGTICGGTLVTGTGDIHRLGPGDRIDGIRAPQPLVGDCGAFGIRTSVVLKTMKLPETTVFSSFDFATGPAALDVLVGLSDLPCLGEAYVFDPGTHANLAKTGFSVIESVGIAGDLLKGKGGGLFGRLGGLVRTARAGKAFVADLAWSLHISFDGETDAVERAQAEATRRAVAAGGEIIPDIIPRVTRARPFRKIKALVGPDGEAWLPLHGVFEPGDAQNGLRAAQAVLDDARAEMARHGIRAVLLAVLMGQRIVIEPQLFWPDSLGPAIRRKALPQQIADYGGRPANPAARTAALDLRKRLTAALAGAGATHFQLGRTYAVPQGTRDTLLALKQRFDPDRIINPGVLGL
jgi:FAD/FMN-containing dehydrogenase